MRSSSGTAYPASAACPYAWCFFIYLMSSDDTESPIFSTELIDIFIDYLRDDPLAISACALVCKAWLPRSRFHQFGTVILHPGNIAAFVKLFHFPNETEATVIPYIRHFEYHYLRLHSILHRLPEFPRVTALTLRGIRVDTELYLSTVFPNLVDFKCTDSEFVFGLNVDMAHLRSHPMSQRLIAADVVSVFGAPVADCWRHFPSSLQSLYLWPRTYEMRTFYLWLSAHPEPPKLRRLNLHAKDGSDLQACLAYIRDFGDDLVELTLYVAPKSAPFLKGSRDTLASNVLMSHV